MSRWARLLLTMLIAMVFASSSVLLAGATAATAGLAPTSTHQHAATAAAHPHAADHHHAATEGAELAAAGDEGCGPSHDESGGALACCAMACHAAMPVEAAARPALEAVLCAAALPPAETGSSLSAQRLERPPRPSQRRHG